VRIRPLLLSEIKVTNDEGGPPHAVFNMQHFDISIARDGDYAVAVALRTS
jgi:phosphopantetheinyl transferase (holo-ACP synthase)